MEYRHSPLVSAAPALLLFLLGCESSTEPTSLCETQTEIPAAQCEALVALYEATNGPGWTDAEGWLETETPCTWTGVGCVGGSVDGLELPGNGLSGPIPPELGSLENLRFLYLWDNALNGTIPAQLGDLPTVRRIILRQNELTGTIPPELGALASLDWLMLNDNRLSGTVPEALADLEGLDVLWIHENHLEGPLPLGIAQLGAAIQEEHIAEDCAARPGNDGLFIPDDDAYRAADLDGDGLICGLSVPPGAYRHGRSTS